RRVRPLKHPLKWSQEFRKCKIDILHARFGTAGMEMLKTKLKTGLPMITSFHGHDNPRNEKNRKRYRHLKKLFEHGEMFTVTNEQMKDILIDYGCPERKIHIQHSGIDLSKFPYKERKLAENEPIKILFVGRLVEKKGAKFLVKAFKKVLEEFPHAQLTMVGDGDQRRKVQKQVDRLKLNKSILMIKQCNHQEVIRRMQDTHLFCLPSVTGKNKDQEGIP
ncbi:glycosyltransferase, partial [Cutibacterium acnes]